MSYFLKQLGNSSAGSMIVRAAENGRPQDTVNRDRDIRGARPAHLRQSVNPPIRFGDFVSH